MNVAVIFAGGTGRRMNTGALPKQFLEYKEKPIIIYTLELFERHPEIDAIVVACLKGWIPRLKEMTGKFGLKKVRAIVPGGETGQDSIRLGLEAAASFADNESIVLIHDGVRPLINERTITDNIRGVENYGSCITCVPATETFIINTDGEQYIPHRSDCQIARAPQSFRLGLVLGLHKQAAEAGRHDFIDCCSMARHYGYPLHTIEGPMENIKVTTPSDFFIFKTLIEIKEERQIYGY